jgi:hypothetical protein
LVISKPVRSKKKILPNYILEDTTPKRITTRDKVIMSLKNNTDGLSLIGIGEDANIPSQGNLHAVMKRMLVLGEVYTEQCSHCKRTELYKINI